MKRVDKALVFLAFGLIFAGTVFSFVSNRAFVAEAGTWFMYVLERKSFYFDIGFYRLTDRILQIPAVLILNLVPYKPQMLAIYSLSFMYIFHPVVSLYLCYRIVKHFGRLDLFIFPLLSYVIATIPVLPQVTIMVPGALGVLWPLLLLSVLVTEVNKKIIFYVIALLLLLTFAYEPVIILLPLFVGIGLYNQYILKNPRPYLDKILIYLPLAGIVWISLFLLYAPISQQANSFLGSLKEKWDIYRLSGAGFIVVLLFILLTERIISPRFKRALLLPIVALAGFIVSGFFLYFPNTVLNDGIFRSFNMYTMNYARTTAIPFAFGVAFIFLFYFYSDKAKRRFESLELKWLFRVLCMTVILGVIIDFRITLDFRNDFSHFNKITGMAPGCRKVSYQEFAPQSPWFPVPVFAVHATNILTRIMEGQYPVEGFVLATEKEFPNMSCPKTDNNVLFTPSGNYINLNAGIEYTPELINNLKPGN